MRQGTETFKITIEGQGPPIKEQFKEYNFNKMKTRATRNFHFGNADSKREVS